MVIREFAGAQFSVFKNALADLAVARLTPIAVEMQKLLADPAEIDRVLKTGASRADAIAAPIMQEVRRLVGFVA
jgi:tryptophanyl-tRNA synthetase